MTRPRSAVSRTVTAALIGLFCHTTDLVVATADTLRAVDGGSLLQEASYHLDIRVRGVIAEVDVQQTFINRDKVPHEARFEFDLPDSAAITSFGVQLADGRTSHATLVGAMAAVAKPPDPLSRFRLSRMEPDVGVLRLIERESFTTTRSPLARATYEMHVYPVPGHRSVTVRYRWIAPMRYDDGRLSVRIPARGAAKNLAASNVRLTVQPPRGATALDAVYGAGRMLARKVRGRRQFRFSAWNKSDLVVEAVPVFSARSLGKQSALVLFDTVPISKQFGAAAVTVLTPVLPGHGTINYERVIIVADQSRSMRQSGVAAVRQLVAQLLSAVPTRARFELITYDRDAAVLFNRLRPINRHTRAAAQRALTRHVLRNGSDLGAALDKANAAFASSKLPYAPPPGISRGAGANTLVVLISDGVVPLALTPKRAEDRLGRDVLRTAEVLSIAVVPDDVPLPSTSEGPMAALALRTGGNSIAVRHREAKNRAKTIARELGRPAPFRVLDLRVSGAALEGMGIAGKLRPGQGRSAFGWYHGKRPRSAMVLGNAAGTPVQIASRSGRATGARVVLPLALAAAELVNFIPVANRLGTRSLNNYPWRTLAAAQQRLLGAASKAPAVTRYSSMVATAPGDAFARDRLMFAKKWGASMFFRVAPPPERSYPQTLDSYRERQPKTTVIAHGHVNSGRYRRTGTLGRLVIQTLITRYVYPKARVCYERALRHAPELRGQLTLVLEMARGEVQTANAVGSTLAATRMSQCLVAAAYTIRVPRVRYGADPEAVSVVRYPFRFAPAKHGGRVTRGTAQPAKKSPLFNPHKPLPGLAN